MAILLQVPQVLPRTTSPPLKKIRLESSTVIPRKHSWFVCQSIHIHVFFSCENQKTVVLLSLVVLIYPCVYEILFVLTLKSSYHCTALVPQVGNVKKCLVVIIPYGSSTSELRKFTFLYGCDSLPSTQYC